MQDKEGEILRREKIYHPNTLNLPNLLIQQVFIEGFLWTRQCCICDKHVPGSLLFLMETNKNLFDMS